MRNRNSFDQQILNQIFTISAKHHDRLSSRESTWLEFKEAFNFAELAKYIRTAAAFANAKGGYIVYGIGANPHKLLGLKNEKFNELDPARLSHFLNEHFDPEVIAERHLYELDGKTYGILFIQESHNKPVMCRKGSDDGRSLKEGEIYYRYGGRTQTVRYAELKMLLEERREHEQQLWLQHLREITRIGAVDAGVFDFRTGKVSGTAGNFLIDESLLPQLAFIKEGEFDEKKGKPTIKIIGEAKTISGGVASASAVPQIVKTKGIRSADIILSFLKSSKVDEPQNYFTQICYENSAFLPFYFLLKQASLSLDAARTLIEEEHSTHVSKSKLLDRLNDDLRLLCVTIPTQKSAKGRNKLVLREQLLKKQLSLSNQKELREVLQMVRTLEASEIDEQYLKKHLHSLFMKYYAKGDSVLNDDLRRAIAFLDWKINSYR